MNATDVLEAAEHAGAHLYLSDGVIRASGASHLPPELRAAITNQKADLMVLLAAELDETRNAPTTSNYEADTDRNVLLMVACYERWPERAAEWRDVDWANPVEVAVRVLGARITRVAAAP